MPSNDPRPAIAYGNHSCDPNLWWTDAVTLEARRDIAAGDEVTSDYGTSTGVDFDHWIPVLLRKQRAG